MTSNLQSVYKVLAADMKRLGIESVFGLISEDTVALVTAIEAVGIKYFGARHETNAVAMAEGYAWATGGLGVAIIGRGPAAANGMLGVLNASRSGASVLVIVGEAATQSNAIGPDNKKANTVQMYGVAGLPTFVATSPTTARPALVDAIAAAGQGQLVSLHLPTNVQHGEIEATELAPAESAGEPAVMARARPEAVDAAVALLNQSRYPLIVAGLGAHRAGAREALEQLAERTGALLVTTLLGRDMFAGRPYNLGIIGTFSHSVARRLIEQSDCVLAVGASLNKWTTSHGTFVPAAPIIQIDVARTNIGRYTAADVALVGDARVVAEQLLASIEDRSPDAKPFHTEAVRTSLVDFRHEDDFEATQTTRTIDPRLLALKLNELLPPERTVVTDAGNFFGVVPFVSVPGPDHFKLASSFSAIGVGLGTALGVAAARPDVTTVLFTGDGSLLMALGELETTVREDLPLVIVVMNDRAYGAERHYLELRGMPINTSVFPDTDFASLAAVFGFETATIQTVADVEKLAELLERPEGPILLDCKITPEVIAPFLSGPAA